MLEPSIIFETVRLSQIVNCKVTDFDFEKCYVSDSESNAVIFINMILLGEKDLRKNRN